MKWMLRTAIAVILVGSLGLLGHGIYGMVKNPLWVLEIQGPHLRSDAIQPVSSIEGQQWLQLLLQGDFASLTKGMDTVMEGKDWEARVASSMALRAFQRPEVDLVEHLDAWVEAYPDSPSPHLARAAYYVNLGLRARGTAWTRNTSAWNLKRMGFYFDWAQRDLDRVYEISDHLVQPYELALTMAKQRGTPESRRMLYDAGLKRDPGSYDLHETYLYSLDTRWGGEPGQTESFLADIREKFEEYPHLAAVANFWELELLGRRDGKPCDHLEDYRVAYNTHANGYSSYKLGRAYSCGKHLVEARRYLRQAVSQSPYNTTAWRLLGLIEAQFGQIEAARRANRVAIALDPTDAGVYAQLAELELATGHYGKSQELYHQASYLAPEKRDYSDYEQLARAFEEAPEASHQLVLFAGVFGQPVIDVTYRDGRREGEAILFNEQGRPAAKQEYQDGQLVKTRNLFPDGKVLSETNHHNGMLHGPFVEYDRQGNVIARGQMVEGWVNGTLERYLANGDLLVRHWFERGQRQGQTELGIPSQMVDGLEIVAFPTTAVSYKHLPLDRRNAFSLSSDKTVALAGMVNKLTSGNHHFELALIDGEGHQKAYLQGEVNQSDGFAPFSISHAVDSKTDKPGLWTGRITLDGHLLASVEIPVHP